MHPPAILRLSAAALVAVFSPFAAPSCSDQEPTVLISPSVAADRAQEQLTALLPTQPTSIRRATEGAEPAEALLVERLDRPDNPYYLVPFSRQELMTLVVMLDAHDGHLLRVSAFDTPTRYPPVNEESARSILAGKLGVDVAGGISPPTLVWKPSHQSQSPYEPLWCFLVGDEDWYVDQTGAVWNEIDEPLLKGGGPPGE